MRKRNGRLGPPALLLALALLAAACSNEGGATTDEPGAAAGEQGANGAAATEEAREISILSTSPAPYTQTVSDWDDNRYVQKLEELSGNAYDLHFEFLSWQDFQTQLTVRFASGDLPDLIRTYGLDYPAHTGAVEQGAVLELTDLIEQYGPNLKARIPEEAWNSPAVSKDGRIYAIPALVPNPHTRALYVREDWLEQAGMEVPSTPEEYLAYFEQVKALDMNGNGDPNDEYGFYARENMAGSELFFYEFGVYPDLWVMEDGEFVPSVITDNMKDVLQFWRELYANGYVNPNLFTNKSADWFAGIQNGLAGSWVHYVDNYVEQWDPSQFIDQPEAEPIMVEPPAGPGGKGLQPVNAGIYYVWMIPSDVERPEQIIEFLDWAWSSDEVQEFYAYGIEGHNYELRDGQIVWGPDNPNNADNMEMRAYQINVNVTGHSLNGPKMVELSPQADALKAGFDIAERNTFMNEAMYMPQPEAFETRPELIPNFAGGGTMLLDMFAKVVTGREEVDAGFESFVQEWRSRGGDEAIAEATQWHRAFYGE
ncbi:extracellular solute-binding protein [Paenibacillus sp. IB182496]|uniref:Extracellular solute-binding protein n=1 Tax=Paenibacillus sabuli TaxID=2772509 RepID=A0A927BPE5_9BACL|nr:extracellular solute-binding protein [Paenibacillus sabuli]MBD2843832.1 extracellular solute-binding protein [Paenibacillus sabuli]